MVYFALFTVGYIVGVITFLFIFPPNMKEIEEQEVDALQPIIDVKVEKKIPESQESISGVLAKDNTKSSDSNTDGTEKVSSEELEKILGDVF